MGAEPEPEQPNPITKLQREIAESPAFTYIAEYLNHARALGLDLSDPETVRRAINAGVSAFNAITDRTVVSQLYSELDIKDDRATYGRAHRPIVYYMRMSELVKIGTTTNIHVRLKVVGAQGVMAVEPGGRRLEAERHEQFAHLRSHGEWFLLSDVLGIHIAEARRRFEVGAGQTVEQWLNEHQYPYRRGRAPGTAQRVAHVVVPPTQPIDGLLCTRDVIAAIGVSRALFAYWRKMDKIHPALRDDAGRPFYRLADAQRVDREMRQSPRSSRRR